MSAVSCQGVDADPPHAHLKRRQPSGSVILQWWALEGPRHPAGSSVVFILHWIGPPSVGRGTVAGAGDLDASAPLLVLPLEVGRDGDHPALTLSDFADLAGSRAEDSPERVVRAAVERTGEPESSLGLIEVEGERALYDATRELIHRVLARALPDLRGTRNSP